MIILILALLFGIAVFIFTLKSYNKGKEAGTDSKFIKILKLAVLLITLLYIVIFVFVFLKTLFM